MVWQGGDDMNGLNSNVTTLFNSLGGGSSNSGSAGSIDLASYAAIKNGSYAKLAKAYYSEGTQKSGTSAASSANSSKGSEKTSSANKDVDTTGLTQMRKDADSLKTAAEAFDKADLWKKTDGKEDMSAIAGAVKDFANSYNKVIDQASKVNSKEVSQDMKFMTGMTDTFSKILNKIGVSVGDDGKLSVDEEALKKADVATVKSIFSGNMTYGDQIAEKASNISKDTQISTSIYGNDASVTSAVSSLYNQFV